MPDNNSERLFENNIDKQERVFYTYNYSRQHKRPILKRCWRSIGQEIPAYNRAAGFEMKALEK